MKELTTDPHAYLVTDLEVRHRRRPQHPALLGCEILLELVKRENIEGLLPALVSVIFVINTHCAPPTSFVTRKVLHAQ